jgi:hypothetical protein
VDQSGLITPLEKLTHGRPVRRGKHECFHLSLGGPAGSGPVHMMAITEETGCEIAVGSLGLKGDSECPEREKRQVVQRSDTKASDGDDGHAILCSECQRVDERSRDRDQPRSCCGADVILVNGPILAAT